MSLKRFIYFPKHRSFNFFNKTFVMSSATKSDLVNDVNLNEKDKNNYSNDNKSIPKIDGKNDKPENEKIENLFDKLKISEKSISKKLESLDTPGIAKYLQSCKNIIFMTGAGISTAAGIPDFRSPGTGLYANLAKYNLPYPHAVFDIDFFLKDPQPFYSLAKELMPSKYKPTISHYFQQLLIEKGHVLRVYTQNIDTLESVANIPENKVINAHGSFKKGHCMNCNSEYSFQWMKEKIQEQEYMKCENSKCMESKQSVKRIVKPDITFFGENLPNEFLSNYKKDFNNCDLLIVMGTSLHVQPFGSLTNMVDDDCPRLLINRDLVGDFMFTISEPDLNTRDVFIQGDCDDGCLELAKHLGFDKELIELKKNGHEQLDKL